MNFSSREEKVANNTRKIIAILGKDVRKEINIIHSDNLAGVTGVGPTSTPTADTCHQFLK